MEKCFDFSSFAANLINMVDVIPVKMVVNSYTYVGI